MLCSARVCQDKCSSHAVKEWQYMILNKNIASVHKTLTIYSTQISNPASHTHYEHCTSFWDVFVFYFYTASITTEKRTLTTLDSFPSMFGSLQQKWFSWNVRGMSAQHQNRWRLECAKTHTVSILHVRLDSHTILLCWCPSWKRINLHHIWIEDHKDGGSLQMHRVLINLTWLGVRRHSLTSYYQ